MELADLALTYAVTAYCLPSHRCRLQFILHFKMFHLLCAIFQGIRIFDVVINIDLLAGLEWFSR